MKICLTAGQRLSQSTIAAISLLNYSNVEIARYVNEALEANPLLEALENEEEAKLEKIRDKFEWLAINDEQNKYFYKTDYERDERGEIFEIAEAKPETLEDALYEQLYAIKLSEKRRALCEYIIESLDSSGWFEGDIKEIAHKFLTSQKEVNMALKTLQSFEPVGVCAKSLTECLLIQLRRLYPKSSLAEKIVRNDLDFIGRRKTKELAIKYNVTETDIANAVGIISGLNPRPSSGYASKAAAHYIEPDVIVSLKREGVEVLLNEACIPELRVNPEYVKLLYTGSVEIRKYVGKKLKQAEWTIKSIDVRRQTICRIAEAIVEAQMGFFTQGSCIKPLTMREIADELSVHESTVSRAVKNKYLSCVRGCFPFSYFFDNKIRAAEDYLSSKGVKSRLRYIIEREDKCRPYSDEKLTELLNGENIAIKRRTVAKYRAELGFPPARQRYPLRKISH